MIRGVIEIKEAILECIQEGFGDYEIYALVPEVRKYANPIKYIKMLRTYTRSEV